MSETASQRTARLLNMSNAQLIMHAQDLTKRRDELLADVAEEAAVREKLATLLAETAVALKGPEAALFRHSWHDLADVAAGVVKQRDELLAALDVIIPALESRANGDSYLSKEQYDAVKKCRDIKSDVKGGAK